MSAIKGEPVAPRDVLLRHEIKDWTRRWRKRGLTLDQARVEARDVLQDIGKRRGKAGAEAWWAELIAQEPRLA